MPIPPWTDMTLLPAEEDAWRKPALFLLALLLAVSCFTLGILPFRHRSIIPGRLICGFLALALLLLLPRLRERLARTPAAYALAAYALVCLLSTLANGLDPLLAGTGLAWLCVFLAFWCLGTCLGEGGRLPFLILGASALIMLLSILLLGRDGLGLINMSAFQSGGGDRLVGFFGSKANRLAPLLAAAAFFFLGAGLLRPRGWRSLWFLGGFLGLGLFLLNTAARAWMGIFFGVTAVYLALRRIPPGRILAGGLAVFLLLTALHLAGAKQVRLYFQPDQALSSLLSRLPIWEAALAQFREHKWLGAGPESYPDAYARFYDARLAGLSPREQSLAPARTDHAHNILLSPLGETGLLGCLSLNAAILLAIFAGLRGGPLSRDAAFFLICLWLASMVNPALSREPGTVMAAALGLAASRPSPDRARANTVHGV
ncbi:MAG: O-antigen ligase family protein [Desulfovibrio sp.]|nr:O-antigen ligase family protein [Desulfovibrio sp.]